MTCRYRLTLATLALSFLATGCQNRAAADAWLGVWNGPEGTFLKLEGDGGKYSVTIQDLDGPRTYAGTAVDGTVQFERNGVKEVIRASNGTQTGMKWLAGKSDCLTVRPGEGYCRD